MLTTMLILSSISKGPPGRRQEGRAGEPAQRRRQGRPGLSLASCLKALFHMIFYMYYTILVYYTTLYYTIL